MRLVKKCIILLLILGLTLFAVPLVWPIAILVFQFVFTLLPLIGIGIAILYLCRKLRA